MKKTKYYIISFLLLLGFLSIIITTTKGVGYDTDPHFNVNSPFIYTPEFDALNIKETMTISPIFTPDNALDIHKAWIDLANTTIDLQNQYITQFDDDVDWGSDPSPIIRSLIDAHDRGVNIRVQVNEGGDSDNVTSYLQSENIDVKWMGTSASSNGSYLSNTHNKIVIIDNKVTLISSINFGKNAFTYNREAGMVIQSTTVANYYTSIFESDWADGEEPPTSPIKYTLNENPSKTEFTPQIRKRISYSSPTDIPRTNFTDTYNVTLFTNPDNADEVIFSYLKSAKESVYVSMYTISRPDFNKTLIDLKNANPSMDIQVLISNRRFGHSENVYTASAARSLVKNLIPVYNSTKDLNFYHNKYWIIDGTQVFVYSGNWSPRSVTPQLEPGDTSYSSSEANRDMGIAVHDAPDIASFFKKEVWDADVAVADAWELPVGIKQTSFTKSDVVSGTVTLSAQTAGLDNATVSYKLGTEDFTQVTMENNAFSVQFDTQTIPNGITTFKVKAETTTQTFTDDVRVNIVNYDSDVNWRFLITELLPDPSTVSDAEGEYIEITNCFPFNLLIEDWQIGDDKSLYTFPSDYLIAEYSSIIIAKDLTGFENAHGIAADIELAIALTNTGDLAQLLDHKGNYLDVVAYGDVTAPDGSEVLEAPDAGEAILRTPLHIDTDTDADFSFGTPDPKGNVPHVSLNAEGSITSGSEDTPLSWSTIIIMLVILPIIRRKSK
ncbi:MAG: phospholipase D-like domain-containing protein [Candidatus Hodarchaeales archaeon]|jgi:phosphatidylserine/phosphatidylglycerophosphate/cardiolipin synthase-like enzyme